jgi:hypothetical protein
MLPPALHAAHPFHHKRPAGCSRAAPVNPSCSQGHSLYSGSAAHGPSATRRCTPAAVRVKTVNRNSLQAQYQAALPMSTRMARGGWQGGSALQCMDTPVQPSGKAEGACTPQQVLPACSAAGSWCHSQLPAAPSPSAPSPSGLCHTCLTPTQ